MSTDLKAERLRLVSGSSTFVLTVDQGSSTPTTTEPIGSISRTTDGRLWRSLGGGSWEVLGDTTTLSGTINARFVSLSGSIDGRFAKQAVSNWTGSDTYPPNAAVIRGPYVWRANTTTIEDPFLVEGDLGSGSDWFCVTASGGSGFAQGNGSITFIAASNGEATTAYRQSTNSGFLGKMLVVDISLQGSADWFHFGVYNATGSQTFSNINFISSSFFGVNINIFNARVENYRDGLYSGLAAENFSYTNANATNASLAYSRWYLRMVENGSNWDLILYRDSRVAGATVSGQSTNQIDDIAEIGRFTNQVRPSYTNWRFVMGARTGGANGTFKARAAWVRDQSTGNWSAVAKRPTQLD